METYRREKDGNKSHLSKTQTVKWLMTLAFEMKKAHRKMQQLEQQKRLALEQQIHEADQTIAKRKNTEQQFLIQSQMRFFIVLETVWGAIFLSISFHFACRPSFCLPLLSFAQIDWMDRFSFYSGESSVLVRVVRNFCLHFSVFFLPLLLLLLHLSISPFFRSHL